MLRLTLQLTGTDPQTFHFVQPTHIQIGRKSTNSVCIADSRISGEHGCIQWTKSGPVYQDLRSTNGSLVIHDGERTVVDGQATAEVALADGDLLLLGDVDNPVVLEVAVETGGTDELVAEGTIVAKRPMGQAGELSRLLLPVSDTGDQPDRLLQLLRALGGERDLEAAFGHVAGYLLSRLARARAVVLVIDGDEPWILGRSDSAIRRAEPEHSVYPKGLVAAARAQGEALLSVNQQGSPDASLVRLESGGAIAVPLGQDNEIYGALVVIGDGVGVTEAELEVTTALAYQVQSCFDTSRLIRRLRSVERRLRDENRYLRSQVGETEGFGGIIGESPAIKAVFDQVRVVVSTRATVLITGETGTGKELIARALHDNSPRAKRLFAPVNCAAISENLLESELFGHVKGAFTGASDNKKGLFQVADGGTLFLDEIGELSPKLQAKLLRVLQEGEVTPVGSSRSQKVDIRILCATHRDLRKEVAEGRFREDLFYRVNVFPIHIPALRERAADIPLLAEFFVGRYAAQFGRSVPGLTEGAIRTLQAYAFPGNIRELENEIQRAVLLAPEAKPIDVSELSFHVRGGATSGVPATASGPIAGSLKETMELLERGVLKRALEARGWNRSATARELGISRQALMVKLSKYKLAPESDD